MATTSEHTTAPLKLPIDVVPGSSPPIFRWKHVVHTPWGMSVQDCESSLPPSCEQAVADLIALVKRLQMENTALRLQVDGMDKLIEGAAKDVARVTSSDNAVPMPTSTDTSKPKKGLR